MAADCATGVYEKGHPAPVALARAQPGTPTSLAGGAPWPACVQGPAPPGRERAWAGPSDRAVVSQQRSLLVSSQGHTCLSPRAWVTVPSARRTGWGRGNSLTQGLSGRCPIHLLWAWGHCRPTLARLCQEPVSCEDGRGRPHGGPLLASAVLGPDHGDLLEAAR